jgi:hypothetical protein
MSSRDRRFLEEGNPHAKSADRDLTQELETVRSETNAVLRIGASPLAQLILGTIPYAGGVGAVLAQRMQMRQEVRLRTFLLEVVTELSSVQIQGRGAEPDRIDSDEYVALVHDVLEQVASSRDADRLTYLRQFLVSASLNDRPDETWLELFLRYLGSLAGAHLVALGAIYKRQRGIPATDRLGRRRIKNVPISVGDLATGQYTRNLLRICMADLSNHGLVADWQALAGDTEYQESYSLTRNGMLFMRFVEGEWGTDSSE